LGIGIEIQKNKKEDKNLQEIVPKTHNRSKGKLKTKTNRPEHLQIFL
jgi:hypothetical protein